MLRRSTCLSLRATPVLRVWAAEEDDAGAPPTTFKNVKPGLLLRWWRQVRQRAWVWYTWDEEMVAPTQEGYLHQQRLEQVCFAPLSAYGMVPGSYCDPLLYNTKNTSPFRWHASNVKSDIIGHWYLEMDEMLRIKDWQPRNPDDPLEMFPRPPQTLLNWEESVDEHGNRSFRYKYSYEFCGPTGKWESYPRYPFTHVYAGGTPDTRDRVEKYGFKQGHLLRCEPEEEAVLRRIMEEEDKEWEMVKRTEIIQEPWSYPGKIRPQDFNGAVDRAKKRWREQIRQGKETDPSEDPEYDLVQAGEYVEPRDGPRAEWRHLWTTTRRQQQQDYEAGKHNNNKDNNSDDAAAHYNPADPSIAPLPFQVTFNDGIRFEDNEGRPPAHPHSHYEETPKEAPYAKFADADTRAALEEERRLQAARAASLAEAMAKHKERFGDTSGAPSGPTPGAPTGCPPNHKPPAATSTSTSSSSSSSSLPSGARAEAKSGNSSSTNNNNNNSNNNKTTSSGASPSKGPSAAADAGKPPADKK